MGGADKGLLPWGDSSLVASVTDGLRNQVDTILISANRNLDSYRELGFPVVSDALADYQGPLAGIAAALARCNSDIAVVVPCDTPMLPGTLVERLLAPLQDPTPDLSLAHDGERRQYLCSAIRRRCLLSLENYLQTGGRSVKAWHEQLEVAVVDFSDCPGAFVNLNREEDFHP